MPGAPGVGPLVPYSQFSNRQRNAKRGADIPAPPSLFVKYPGGCGGQRPPPVGAQAAACPPEGRARSQTELGKGTSTFLSSSQSFSVKQ